MEYIMDIIFIIKAITGIYFLCVNGVMSVTTSYHAIQYAYHHLWHGNPTGVLSFSVTAGIMSFTVGQSGSQEKGYH